MIAIASNKILAKANNIFINLYPPDKSEGNRHSIATGFSLWINQQYKKGFSPTQHMIEMASNKNLAKANNIFINLYPPDKSGGNRLSIATGFSLWINQQYTKGL